MMCARGVEIFFDGLGVDLSFRNKRRRWLLLSSAMIILFWKSLALAQGLKILMQFSS